MKTSRITALLLVASVVSACNKTSFSQLTGANDTQTSEIPDYLDPIIPVTPVTPVPPPQLPQLKTGTCNPGESINACLVCETDPPPPVIATKAQKLAKIMSMACQIPNKSYPKDYVAPTAAQVEARLAACTPALYPETPMSAAQSTSIDRLLDTTDASLRQKMFKGIWYQPPHTEHFETYFGLDNTEAANVICMATGTLSNTLATKEYIDAFYGNYDAWLANPAAQQRWQFAQMLRQQLLSCFNKAAPKPMPAPVPAEKKCRTRSFEGNFEQGGMDEVKEALSKGFKLSVESDNACVQIKDTTGAGELKGNLKIIGYKCD